MFNSSSVEMIAGVLQLIKTCLVLCPKKAYHGLYQRFFL